MSKKSASKTSSKSKPVSASKPDVKSKSAESSSADSKGQFSAAPGIASVEDREVVCPSCFRFTGTYEKCPYCGAMVFKRISVRFFRWGSLVFSFIGLLLLWMAAKGTEVPLIKVDMIKPSMSMGFVKVTGRITNVPELHPEWKSLYLRVKDGSGEIVVNAYSQIAETVMEKMTLHKGDEVSIKGMVRFKGRVPKPRLLLQSPSHIEILKKAPPYIPAKAIPMKIGSVNEAMKGKKIILTGLLTESGVLDFGAYRGVLEKDGSNIVVWVEKFKWEKFLPQAKAHLVKGASLTIRGYVDTYFDKTKQKLVLEIIPDGRDGCIVNSNTEQVKEIKLLTESPSTSAGSDVKGTSVIEPPAKGTSVIESPAKGTVPSATTVPSTSGGN